MKNNIIDILGTLIAIVVVAFLLGWFVMLLWNWLMPMIFGLMIINYWQAWGLLLLSGMLFRTSSSSNKQ